MTIPEFFYSPVTGIRFARSWAHDWCPVERVHLPPPPTRGTLAHFDFVRAARDEIEREIEREAA